MPDLANIYRLGIKELWSLARDPVMLVLITYCFSVSIYVAATAVPDSLDKVPIAIVDEDASPLSARIAAVLLSATLQSARDHPARRNGCRHGRRRLQLRAGHSA